jgi:hypothetical protein
MTLGDEGATWTSAGGLGLASLFLALGIALFWRWRRAAASEIAAVQESTARTERLVGEIRAALADAQEKGAAWLSSESSGRRSTSTRRCGAGEAGRRRPSIGRAVARRLLRAWAREAS